MFVALTTIAAGPRPTSAQEKQDEDAYTSVIKRAVVEFGQGHWEEAYALFRQAHEIDPNARTWRGIGISAFELRRYVEATADLEAALMEPRKALTPEQREHAKQTIERARQFVSVYQVRIQPTSAEVVVDGKPSSLRDGQLHLDPGPHTVEVRAAGYEERRTQVQAGAGSHEELSLELSMRGAEERPVEASVPARQQRKRRHRRVWTWSLAGASVATAAVSSGLRLRVNGLVDEHDECVRGGGSCSAIKSRGKKLLNASYGTAGLAGALLAGAVVALFVESEKPNESSAAASLSISPLGLVVTGSM